MRKTTSSEVVLALLACEADVKDFLGTSLLFHSLGACFYIVNVYVVIVMEIHKSNVLHVA
mgnify:CR=1 FL=1